MKRVAIGLLVLTLSLGLFSMVEGAGPSQGTVIPAISNWIKNAANPVISKGTGDAWDRTKTYLPDLLVKTGDEIYLAYYTGSDGSYEKIGLATSTNGTTWTKYSSNPVLDMGNPGAWDAAAVGAPAVVYDGATYRMWYSGHDGVTLQLGLATSEDAANWTKRGDPVLIPGDENSWESTGVGNACVIWQGDVYRMWYSGYDGVHWRIGYATSFDGINWTRLAENPVLVNGPDGSFDSKGVWLPSVVYSNGQFQMWYTGINSDDKYGIGYAISTDGVHWTKSSSNITAGAAGSFDDYDVWSPSVIYYKGSYRLLYTGVNNDNINAIGLATNTPPQIVGPLVAGATVVGGYGTANSTVTIVNLTNSTTLGTGTVTGNSNFAVTVPALPAGANIQAVIATDHSEPQIVLSTEYRVYIPITEINNNGGW